MIVRGATDTDVRRAAELAGVRLNYLTPNGRGWQFTLGPGTSEGPNAIYRRVRQGLTSLGNRKLINAVCFHGHYHFMRALLSGNPSVRIITKMATYEGFQDFLEKAPSIGQENIGSRMEPLLAEDACRCDESMKAVALGNAPPSREVPDLVVA